ncbi:MAG: 1-deoxy-D-xylulose-5-phosphate reductoisomerase [Bacilli bacterium]|nr:1-deoxy-D-xylulose-5-phosphate reductoisomerase [Bacilli bacterium]
MKNIILLGATGSIGTQVLDIIEQNPNEYTLKAFSFGHNIKRAKEIIEKFKPELVCSPFKEIDEINDIQTTNDLKDVVWYGSNEYYVVNALVGICGLIPTIETIKSRKVLLLANKESLVMAGELVNSLKKEYDGVIVPIDSEHSALYQLIIKNQNIKELYITASGGALRDFSREQLKSVNVNDALNHPNWKMGSKITIDSATMMNKAFEIIEAHYLFDFPIEKIHAVIDRKSKIHAFLELEDGVVYHMAENDMHLPIKYALEYPNSIDFNLSNELTTLEQLKENFKLEKLSSDRFPLIKAAEYVLNNKHFSGVIVTTANDILVDKFLKQEISFLDIEEKLFEIMNKYQNSFKDLELNIENILKVQEIIRKEIR